MIHKIIFYFRSIYIDTFLKRRYLCSIKYINEKSQELIYLCRGKGILITISFYDIINRYDFITNFTPDESALIGYYFGLHYYEYQKKVSYSINSFDFTKIEVPGKFTIKMIDRYKNIIFGEKDSMETFTSSPLRIFSNREILKKFHSIQACYIGILAGIAYNKSINSLINNQNTNNVISILNRSRES